MKSTQPLRRPQESLKCPRVQLDSRWWTTSLLSSRLRWMTSISDNIQVCPGIRQCHHWLRACDKGESSMSELTKRDNSMESSWKSTNSRFCLKKPTWQGQLYESDPKQPHESTFSSQIKRRHLESIRYLLKMLLYQKISLSMSWILMLISTCWHSSKFR